MTRSLQQAIEKALADAAKAKAEAEAAGPDAVDFWDLLDLDERVSGPAWARYMGKLRKTN
jgi:hypothetical protein